MGDLKSGNTMVGHTLPIYHINVEPNFTNQDKTNINNTFSHTSVSIYLTKQ